MRILTPGFWATPFSDLLVSVFLCVFIAREMEIVADLLDTSNTLR